MPKLVLFPNARKMLLQPLQRFHKSAIVEMEDQPHPHDPSKWPTSQGGFSVTGATFMNWNCGTGGGAAIGLAIHLRQRGFRDSLLWLGERWAAPPPLPEVRSKISLQLPLPAPQKIGRVQHYLRMQRPLPNALTDPLASTGLIYLDFRANNVFLQLDQKNQPVGAELRGSTPRPWRGLAPGSEKNQGFFAIGLASSPRPGPSA